MKSIFTAIIAASLMTSVAFASSATVIKQTNTIQKHQLPSYSFCWMPLSTAGCPR